jgi:AcrR family transcriptional regulator
MNSGLRERKKAATRRALSESAMRLAFEHGVPAVTAEAVAADVGVSTRTFHNYFPTKEAAIIAVIADRINELIEELKARPVDEPVWDSLRIVMTGSVARDPEAEDSFFRQMTLIHDNIGLLHEHLGVLDDMGTRIAEVIAGRTGTDAEHDLYPRLQAAAAGCCIKIAADRWWQSGRERDLPAFIGDAFDQLRAGLPEPRHRAPSPTT